MTTIRLSGILSDGVRVLLVRDEGGVWDLPGGVLGDQDESIEAALVRLLDEDLGLRVDDQEFLDTYYPAGHGGTQPALRNVSLVRSWSGFPRPALAETEAAWVALEEVSGLAVDETALLALRDGLGLGLSADEAPLSGAPIILVTGPAGAGKSTVSHELCRRLERSAYISVDAIRSMVISGHASPIPGRSNPLAAAEQNDLQLANVAALARNFSLAGFSTIIDMVVEAPEELDCYLEPFAGLARMHVVTLLPSPEAVRSRDQGRAPESRMGERSQELHRIIAASGETRGLRLDSSEMTPAETVDYILQNFEQSRVL